MYHNNQGLQVRDLVTHTHTHTHTRTTSPRDLTAVVRLPSSLFLLLTADRCRPSSVICLPSSVVCRLSSVFCLLTTDY